MYQPYPSGGQLGEPPRPAVPAPVRTAVKFMYTGAALSAVPLIITLASIGDINGYHLRWNDHNLTAAQISHWRPLIITVAVVGGLVVPAVWLWMARANGRGRNWARVVSTVLFGVATLDMVNVFITPPIRVGSAPTVLSWLVPVLSWLAGLAAVWLLWRPDSSAFFKPQGIPQAGHSAPPSSPVEPSSRLPRQL
jgi:hypothetical protein